MDKQEGEMTFLDHLEVFRWHLIKSILAITGMAVLAFIFKKFIFDVIIIAPRNPGFWTNRQLCKLAELLNTHTLCINQHPFKLISPVLAGQFTIHITISLLAGLILASPYVLYQFWTFIAPALYHKERKYARTTILVSSGLFFIGIIFGYFLIAPFTIFFLGSYSVSEQVENYISLMSYISTIASVVLAGGIAFELPVIVYFLSVLGIITPSFMVKYRKHSIIVILIVAAIISSPDVFSQIMVAIPLVLLYEVSILISRRIYKRKQRELAG
jgi:sec-independent protein translocase protein TatC